MRRSETIKCIRQLQSMSVFDQPRLRCVSGGLKAEKRDLKSVVAAAAGGVQGGKLERVPAPGMAAEPGEGCEASGRLLGLPGRVKSLPDHAPLAHPPLRIHLGPHLLWPALRRLQPALPVLRHRSPGHAAHGLRGGTSLLHISDYIDQTSTDRSSDDPFGIKTSHHDRLVTASLPLSS